MPVKLEKQSKRKSILEPAIEPEKDKSEDENQDDEEVQQLLVIGFDNKPRGKNPLEKRNKRGSLTPHKGQTLYHTIASTKMNEP